MSGPDMSMLSPRELRQRYGTPDDGRLNERVAASIARPGGGGRGGTEGRHMTERSGGGAVSLLRRRFDKVGDAARRIQVSLRETARRAFRGGDWDGDREQVLGLWTHTVRLHGPYASAAALAHNRVLCSDCARRRHADPGCIRPRTRGSGQAGPDGEMMFAYEKSGWLNRQVCGTKRALTIQLDTSGGREAPALRFERPLRCGSFCCLGPGVFGLQELHTLTVDDQLVGSVVQRCKLIGSQFDVYVMGEHCFTITGPLCVIDSAFCDMEFRVCSPQLMQLPAEDGQASHTGGAEIRKLRSDGVQGWLQEAFSDADNFGIAFPQGARPADKAVLMSAVFLIDFMFFETSGSNNGRSSNRGRGMRRGGFY